MAKKAAKNPAPMPMAPVVSKMTMKELRETRRVDLIKMAKKMGIKVDGTPPQTELVSMIANKKGMIK